MKKELHITVIITILLSIILCFGMSVETTIVKDELDVISECFNVSSKLENNSPDAERVQDGRFITNLQWFSPNGELPGTYKKYLSMHPIKTASFTHLMDVDAIPQANKDYSISILVDNRLYMKIKTSINEYIQDLNDEGYSIFLDSVAGGSPEEIKAWVKDRYNLGCTGIVFIGDITAAWAEVSSSVFPCDLFYMDLDGSWTDVYDASGGYGGWGAPIPGGSDGIYDTHVAGSGDIDPEIWIGRIKADDMTDPELDLVKNYLDKNHKYRSGTLSLPQRALVYVDDDWSPGTDVVNAVKLAYSDTTDVHDKDTTKKADYQANLNNQYTWVHVMCHGNPHDHTFKYPDPSPPHDSIYEGASQRWTDYRDDDYPVFFTTCLSAVVHDSQNKTIWVDGVYLLTPMVWLPLVQQKLVV